VFRRGIRLRVDLDGTIEVVDPDPSALELLNALDPEFRIRTAALEGFQGPRLLGTSNKHLAMTASDLASRSTDELWLRHDEVVSEPREGGEQSRSPRGADISLLDLKVELARRELLECRLCGHGCGVDRFHGELGKCRLADAAFVGEYFIHVAEEPPINPSLNVNLMGCGLRCRFCQQFALLPVRPRRGLPLDEALWGQLPLQEVRSLSFVGGNPDESVYAILRFLRGAPRVFSTPIVWNCHGFGTEVVYRLLNGVVDCYIPDFKYWDDECARHWSGALNYRSYVTSGLRAMINQAIPVFVRLLVLPGHFECCHRPALIWLARHLGSRVKIRVMDQYHPDYMVKVGVGEMGRRPTAAEVDQVETLVDELGLVPVERTRRRAG